MKVPSLHLPPTDFSGSVDFSFKREGFTLGSVSHGSLCTSSLPIFSEAEFSWGLSTAGGPAPWEAGAGVGSQPQRRLESWSRSARRLLQADGHAPSGCRHHAKGCDVYSRDGRRLPWSPRQIKTE